MPHRTLSFQEAAQYLHLTPVQLSGLVRQGEIPHSGTGERAVFKLIELDAWASHRLLGDNVKDMEAFHKSSSARQHDLSDEHAIMAELLKPEYIKLDLESKTKSSVLRDMVAVAEGTELLIHPQDLLESLEKREAMASTALNGGVALLHPLHHDPYTFEDSFICIGRADQPIHFGSPDDSRTDLFFLVCAQADDIHLHLLARICMMCYHTSLLFNLREADTADAVHQVLMDAETEIVKSKIS